MRSLLLLVLFALIVVITAIPLDNEEAVGLLDFADVGDTHSNDADRLARHWGRGYGGRGYGGYGYGGRGWGGGYGRHGYGGRGYWG